MKAKIIVLGIMLFSSSTFALADTQKVDAEHLRAHRIYEEENLERQRFKLESEIGKPVSLLWRKNNKSYPPFNFDEYKGTYFFGQYQLNQSGIPLQPSNYGIFKCEPSFSKSLQEYGKSTGVKEKFDGDEGGYETPPNFELNEPITTEEQNKLHRAYSRMICPKRTKGVLKKNHKQPEISLKTESIIILGPYYRERPPRLKVSGCYQNQEWDIYPELEEDKNNSPPYFDFDHSSTKPPPPPMIKTLSKENLPGDSQ